jgi:hypothetical protein
MVLAHEVPPGSPVPVTGQPSAALLTGAAPGPVHGPARRFLRPLPGAALPPLARTGVGRIDNDGSKQ